jgi:hypothetical protein
MYNWLTFWFIPPKQYIDLSDTHYYHNGEWLKKDLFKEYLGDKEPS